MVPPDRNITHIHITQYVYTVLKDCRIKDGIILSAHQVTSLLSFRSAQGYTLANSQIDAQTNLMHYHLREVLS